MADNRTIGALAASIEAGVKMYSRIAPTGRGGFRLARFARRFRRAPQWRGLFQTPDHFSLELDLSTYPDCCMAYGLFELDTARLVKSVLQPGDHFVDGGANIGYFSLLAARRVGVGGRVDAFEPDPRNRARLIENLKRNGLLGIVNVHPCALAQERGQATIYSYSGPQYNHGCSSLFRTADADVGGAPVETVRMDEVLAGTKPKLIKMDLQGAEPPAISGMKGLLQSDRPPQVIVEYEPPCAIAAGFKPREMVDRLIDMQPQYTIYMIDWRLRAIEPRDDVLDNLIGSRGGVNLLFRRNGP